jgi:hypothetical protein
MYSGNFDFRLNSMLVSLPGDGTAKAAIKPIRARISMVAAN